MFYQKLPFTMHEKIIKKSYKNNRLKIPVPTWNKKFDLHDGSYSVSDIEDYFDYIFKNHGENIFNSSITIFIRLKLKQDIILNF